MEHELNRLTGGATRLTADLRRTLGEAWCCSIDEGRMLTLTGGPDVHAAVL